MNADLGVEKKHHILTNSLERNSTGRRQISTNSLERKRPFICNVGSINSSVNLPPMVPVTCNLVQTIGPVIHPNQSVSLGVNQQSILTSNNKTANEALTNDS